MPEPTTLPANVFFELVDAVLTSDQVGRQPLDEGGPQRRIVTVESDDRVLQILAGPGSGKTEMLVWRILFELLVLGSPANSLVVTTFTNKAATELEIRLVERCDQLLDQATRRGFAHTDPHVHDVRVGTLHSLCDGLLREFDDAYMQAGTRLIDEHEALARIAREYRWKLGYSSRTQYPGPANIVCDQPQVSALFRPPWENDRWPVTDMQRVELLRNAIAQQAETWVPRCSTRGRRNGVEFVSPELGVTDALKTVHERWCAYLDEHAAVDFTTIQQRFRDRQHTVLPEIRHVFVDEFQDTNPIQFAIHVGWLAREDTRLTVVGDDDQSVYRFRGSDIACFQGLQAECEQRGAPFRLEKLEDNHRSSRAIVGFNEGFRQGSILRSVGMDKQLRPASGAVGGDPVRLLTGDWTRLCDVVAVELAKEQRRNGGELAPDGAVLMFSTSERNTRRQTSPASAMRGALEEAGLRVFNARNKTAAMEGSPVHDLLALISYLIDPVRSRRVPGKSRAVEVYASHREQPLRNHADTVVPQFSSDVHAAYQKRFRKAGGSLASPAADRADILAYVDEVRTALAQYDTSRSDGRRLTLSAFVARLLSFPYFRNSGYTPTLFRQALFTALLEANIGPTRMTTRSLDEPMRPTMADGKVKWPKQYWDLLRVLGTMLQNTPLDDEEVEAFSENAISMLTFHQSKGLEFDHVYVAATGRDVMPANALRTALFSGEAVPYTVNDGQAETNDHRILDLATADRERETYVALTRAKRHLTILCDPSHARTDISRLNPALDEIFDRLPTHAHPLDPGVLVKSVPAPGGPRE